MTARPPRSLKSKALQLLAQREQSRVELRRKLLAHARACDAVEDEIEKVAAVLAPRRLEAAAGGAAETGAMHETSRAPETCLRAHTGQTFQTGQGDEAGQRGRTVNSDTKSRLNQTGPAARIGRMDKTREDATHPSAATSTTTDASHEQLVDDVIAWLEAQRFLSDERFTESRINARAGRYGNLRIREELKHHGIALTADVAEALRNSETQRAWAVWERRFGAAPASATERARHARFLIARGFSPETVSRVLKRAAAAGDSRGAVAFDDDD